MTKFNPNESLVAAWKAAASGANVPCTGVHQIAQACAAAIFGESGVTIVVRNANHQRQTRLSRAVVEERIANTLDAINASQAGGRKPTS